MKLLPLILLLSIFISQACGAGETASYVGRETCQSCHATQDKLWQGSHHDLAMQHANEKTVLADFSEVTFDYQGITSTFYKKDKKFMVRTDGSDGKLQDYEIKYTFGVTPLQQYLIAFEDGRMQALSIAWDTREKSVGGQRWFHLFPDEKITYKDELHWTRASFNWNGMCAECHSTNLQKNYNSKLDTFTTSWSEIDVSCEACHGPASNHLAWAEKNRADKNQAGNKTGGEKFKTDKGLAVLFDERKDVHWVIDKTGIDNTAIDKAAGNALRSQPRKTEKEIEVCAQCHSRRSAISENYQPGKSFIAHYMPRLLDEGMYFSDGQIQDEVYVYGSFLQSKMYHKGVTCSDCHEPHSLKLRQEGNGVCLQCHAAEKFENGKHHFHKADSTGALCAECHMPSRTYMVVDPRHDHSIRIPRPDLSLSIGTPNACNQCHQDENPQWSLQHMTQWYGEKSTGYKPAGYQPASYQQFAEALDAGRSGKESAGILLATTIRQLKTPDIARASAISIITPYVDQTNVDVLQQGLKDKNPLVRLASVSALEGLPQAMSVQLAFPLLNDSEKIVRIEVARLLAPIEAGQLQAEQLSIYEAASNEYIESQQINAERPEAQLNLGNFYVVKKEYKKAGQAYKKSIELDDAFIPAYINYADLYRVQKNEMASEKILRQAIKVSPENADAQYALGLALIRQKKNKDAIEYLQRAAGYDLSNPHYAYVYAVALNSTASKSLAIDVLQDAQKRFPKNREILTALITFHRDAGNDFAAKTYAIKLDKLNR